MSILHPCANGAKIVEAIDRLMGGPRNSAQEQQTEKRIVERPSVVARDRDEHAAFGLLADPQQRLRLAFLNSAGQEADAGLAANQIPIPLIHEMRALDVVSD